MDIELYRACFNQTFQLIGILDKEGNLLAVNDRALQLVKIKDKAEVLHKKLYECAWWDQTTPQEKEEIKYMIEKAAQGEIASCITRNFDKEKNRLVYVDFSARPYTPNDTTVKYIIVEGRILTEYETAQELKRTENFLQEILNVIDIGIICIDSNLEVTYTNTKALQCEQHKKSNNIRRKYPVISQGINFQLNEVQQKEVQCPRQECTNARCQVSFHPLPKSSGALILFSDVTQKRQMEQLMMQSEKMTSIASLAAGMAHEINSPLSGIMQGLQNLDRRLDPLNDNNLKVANEVGLEFEYLSQYMEKRSVSKIINSIRDAAERASSIVRGMLRFGRQENEIQKLPWNINSILEASLALAKQDIQLKKVYNIREIDFVLELDPMLPVVHCNYTEIEQVILNLLKNATQALFKTTEKPQIILKTKTAGDRIIIMIEDNGPGIPNDLRNRIFDPFFTTKDIGAGTGLGLSVSYSIICNGHNGTLLADNVPGKGARFTIELPCKEQA